MGHITQLHSDQDICNNNSYFLRAPQSGGEQGSDV